MKKSNFVELILFHFFQSNYRKEVRLEKNLVRLKSFLFRSQQTYGRQRERDRKKEKYSDEARTNVQGGWGERKDIIGMSERKILTSREPSSINIRRD